MEKLSERLSALAKQLSPSMLTLLRDMPDDGFQAAAFWNRRENAKRLRTYKALLKRGLADTFGSRTENGRAIISALQEKDL